ncbi:siderophore-interacting protein [Egicoccus halophilus]|uniref:Siderophore-interacting protein n=1 Tax=Egicoccus halophilus TaxID=1670830 RepID=A0A8J3EQW7_9ACTN|nr:siderophore-interacting protein [Egicoccus halophilus]GGI03564.1 siderophore-interacting protein [Egicoccus halophilus]
MYGQVVAVERLTPSMVRITLGGEGLAGFAPVDATDAYVNVAIPPDGAAYTAPFAIETVTQLPNEQRPHRRRYTVRRWNAARRELQLDVVVHGDVGVGGRWAAAAQVGDALVFQGPSGKYRPDPSADWHLFAGDESALPAIAASLEVLPAGVPAVARIVVDGPDHELELRTAADLDLVWLYRGGTDLDPQLLQHAVRSLQAPVGRVHAFVHGEAGEIREVRRHLLAERGVPKADLSCSPYWRRTYTDEAWREVKRDWVAEVERDVA